MRKILMMLVPLLAAGCGPRDLCQAPPAPKPMKITDLTLVQKANILGVPPSQVPAPAKSASSFGALMSSASDNSAAQSAYEDYVARHNAAAGRAQCVEHEAYKARAFKDEMGNVAHAIMATCKIDDEKPALAAVLKYRNCAAGNK